MIRILLSFFVMTAFFWFGIESFRKATGKQKWQLTKTVAYSILCSVLSIIVLTTIVILF